MVTLLLLTVRLGAADRALVPAMKPADASEVLVEAAPVPDIAPVPKVRVAASAMLVEIELQVVEAAGVVSRAPSFIQKVAVEVAPPVE
jgi:hypothetical protein